MRLKVWGARGSVPSPGPETVRYGGNTSCVQVALDDGTLLVLDAGTGIRNLGLALARHPPEMHVLLTHLHLDHIQGLMFFAPAFKSDARLVIWGPASQEASLRDRIARYISAPLTPVEVRELPCAVSFNEAPETEWQIGSANLRAASVTHRGPTLGYRITEEDSSVCYIPDHEPAVGASLEHEDPDWISGFELARDASLLIHDCQYSDSEYPDHLGWGHSGLSDTLMFARRTRAERLMLFHHDPMHSDDYLEAFHGAAIERWQGLGGHPAQVELAWERREIDLRAASRLAAAGRVAAAPLSPFAGPEGLAAGGARPAAGRDGPGPRPAVDRPSGQL